jgi:hypothetical protein
LFYIEIRQVQKRHLIFVTDGNGNPVRHPIKMSHFDERPRFYQSEGKGKKIVMNDGRSVDKQTNSRENHQANSRMLVDLRRLIPDYSEKIG